MSLDMGTAGLHLWSAAESAAASAAKLATVVSHIQTFSDKSESHCLTTLVVQLLVPSLKKLVKVKSQPAGVAVSCCCRILTAMMPMNRPALHRTAATELISSGRNAHTYTSFTIRPCTNVDMLLAIKGQP